MIISISAGYNPHTLQAAPLDLMQEWIDEALDLIEFANGETDTKWGAIRASMGHPKPFGLIYLGIGNEETGDAFFERFELIHQAVKERYPQIRLIGTSGPGCDGEVFRQGWDSAKRVGSSYVDEHYYQSTEWFLPICIDMKTIQQMDQKPFWASMHQRMKHTTMRL